MQSVCLQLFPIKMERGIREDTKRIDVYKLLQDANPAEKEIDWLTEVDKFCLQNAFKNLGDAFSRFFKKQNQYPCFKSKRNPVQKYKTHSTNNNIEIKGNQLKLPKLGWMRFAKSRRGTRPYYFCHYKKSSIWEVFCFRAM